MFCSDAVKQGVQDKDSRSISRGYIHGVSQVFNLHPRTAYGGY